MSLFSLEHGRTAHRLDFALYGATIVALAGVLLLAGARARGLEIALCAAAGLLAWTGAEYALHRFVLHGLPPFRRWHAAHHARPSAPIFAPTAMSAALIAALVLLPAWLAFDRWVAGAFTLGMLTGYLAYSVTHHAVHHWRADSRWLRERKRWHALHHRPEPRPGCYGVTSSFWDHVLRSASPSTRPSRRA